VRSSIQAQEYKHLVPSISVSDTILFLNSDFLDF